MPTRPPFCDECESRHPTDRADGIADKPETIGQAKTWDRVKRRYLDEGLCLRCACQAAYGHQLGFRRSHDPCAGCSPRIAAFPIQADSRWRRLADPRNLVPRSFVRPDVELG
jgi:hypothetical protein